MPDRDGYPTKQELQLMLEFKGTPHEFFDYLCALWEYDQYRVTDGRDGIRKAIKRINISTAGWSGNEEIIGVLRQTWFWFMWWRKSERGGHYTFEVPKDQWDVEFSQKMGLPHSDINK